MVLECMCGCTRLRPMEVPMLKNFLSPGTIPRLRHSPVCTDTSSCLGGGGGRDGDGTPLLQITESPLFASNSTQTSCTLALLTSRCLYRGLYPLCLLHSSVTAWSIFKAVNSLKAESCGCTTWFSLLWRVFHVLQGLTSVCRG